MRRRPIFVDQTLFLLCEIAEEYNLATIDATLSFLDSRLAKRDRVVSDDEWDEVERSRSSYERRNPY